MSLVNSYLIVPNKILWRNRFMHRARPALKELNHSEDSQKCEHILKRSMLAIEALSQGTEWKLDGLTGRTG